MLKQMKCIFYLCIAMSVSLVVLNMPQSFAATPPKPVVKVQAKTTIPPNATVLTKSDLAACQTYINQIEAGDGSFETKIFNAQFKKSYDMKTKQFIVKASYILAVTKAQRLPEDRLYILKKIEESFTLSISGNTSKLGQVVKHSTKAVPYVIPVSIYKKDTQDPLILWLYENFGKNYINKAVFNVVEEVVLTPVAKQLIDLGKVHEYQVTRRIGDKTLDTLVGISISDIKPVDLEALNYNLAYYNLTMPQAFEKYTNFVEIRFLYELKSFRLFADRSISTEESKEAASNSSSSDSNAPTSSDKAVVKPKWESGASEPMLDRIFTYMAELEELAKTYDESSATQDTDSYVMLSDIIKIPRYAYTGKVHEDILNKKIDVLNLYQSEYDIKLFDKEIAYATVALVMPIQNNGEIVNLIVEDLNWSGNYGDNWVVLKGDRISE